MVFVIAELTGFGDNFVDKNLFVMRSMMLYLHSLFLIYILITVLSHPLDPQILLPTLFIMLLGSIICVLAVLMISTIASIIISISWIITISVLVMLTWNHVVQQITIIITTVANKFRRRR
jgi:hypothetical protein